MSKKNHIGLVFSATKPEIAADGLAFGSQHRLLPHELENECLRFVSLSGLGALYLTCHALSAAVIRFLSLHLQDLVCDDLTSGEPETALVLAARYCRGLLRIDTRGHVLSESFLHRLLQNHSQTVRRIDLPHWSTESLAHLKQCRALEHMPLARCPNRAYRRNDSHLDGFLKAAARGGCFPQLKSLEVRLNSFLQECVSWGTLAKFLLSCTCFCSECSLY